ncbi:MAG: dihydroneopterin aldolase [Elusimicrobiota bacterium]
MTLRLNGITLKLFIGDLPWEKKQLQKVSVDIEIRVRNAKPPDYRKLSQHLIKNYSRARYAWLEDLAIAMHRDLKKRLQLSGKLTLTKKPRPSDSPQEFQVEVSL